MAILPSLNRMFLSQRHKQRSSQRHSLPRIFPFQLFFKRVRAVRWSHVAMSLIVIVMLFTWAVPTLAAPLSSAASSPTQAIETDAVQLTADSSDIAAEKVDQFAQAYQQVLQLLSDREPELPAAATTAEALKVEQSIESAAVAIIEQAGLTMPEYMQILSLASQDEAFQDKILATIDEAKSEK